MTGTAPGGQWTLSAQRITVAAPYAADAMAEFLAGHAVAGVESWDGRTYRRTLRLAGGPGLVAIELGGLPTVGSGELEIPVLLAVADPADLPAARAATAWILDAQHDPAALRASLGADPVVGSLVAANQGLRITGAPDLCEAVVRAIVGQQVSVAGARTVLGRMVAQFGTPLPGAPAVDGAAWPVGCWLFPEPAALAGAQTIELAMPRARSRALIGFAAAVAGGRVDPGDPQAVLAALAATPGIGPWTTNYLRLRALRDPDILLATDIGVRRGLRQLGHADDAGSITSMARGWRPWRSYAVAHLWQAAGPAPATRRRPA